MFRLKIVDLLQYIPQITPFYHQYKISQNQSPSLPSPVSTRPTCPSLHNPEKLMKKCHFGGVTVVICRIRSDIQTFYQSHSLTIVNNGCFLEDPPAGEGVTMRWVQLSSQKYLQLQLIMNQEIPSSGGLPALLAPLRLKDLYSVVSYLDPETIATLMKCLPPAKAGKFMQVVRITHFLRHYLTRADRSLYMPFYQQQSFRRIENEALRGLCGHSASTLSYFLASYYHITTRLIQQLDGFELATDVVKDIIDTLIDPELPFPKLRKQTVGSHCNSAFQYYLVDKLFSTPDEDDPGETFCLLRDFIQQRQLLLPEASQEQQSLYRSVLCEWFKISYENYEDWLITGSTAHNLIVMIVALVDLLVDTTRFYIEGIKDPLHCFVEFNLRYCMLRNSILSLQERLSFLFSGYSDYCMRVLKHQPQAREMSIWHIMLSKWYLNMHRHHQEFFKMFFYLLRKVNLRAIQDEIDTHLDQDQVFIQLKNRLELTDIDLLQRQDCFQLYSPLEEYFQNDVGLYKQLIQEYMEYKIDISVNQYSVHWCGFSQHQLHIPYRQFQTLFLPHFTNYLRKVIQVGKGMPRVGIAIDKALCAMLEQIDCDFLKPVTLKKVLQTIEIEAGLFLGISFKQSAIFKKIHDTLEYFNVADKKLETFNKQNNLTNENAVKFSIIVQNEDFNKMLKDSASTAGSRPCKHSKFLQEYHHQQQEFIEQQVYQ